MPFPCTLALQCVFSVSTSAGVSAGSPAASACAASRVTRQITARRGDAKRERKALWDRRASLWSHGT
jgi:hypothetical protein